MAKRRYLVIIEDAGTNLAGYVPDVDTILVTGTTLAEIEAAALDGIKEILREAPHQARQPKTSAIWVEVEVPDDLPPTQ